MGSGCQQAEPNSLASRTPFQSTAGAGGFHRSSPTGGAAYGMPFHTRTVGSSADGRAADQTVRGRDAPLARDRPPATDAAAGCSLAGRAQAIEARPSTGAKRRVDRSAAASPKSPSHVDLLRGESLHRIASAVRRTTLSGALEREGQDLVDRTRAEHHHQQSIDAERHSRAVGQPRLERARGSARPAGGAGRPRRRRCSRSCSKRRLCSAASVSS